MEKRKKEQIRLELNQLLHKQHEVLESGLLGTTLAISPHAPQSGPILLPLTLNPDRATRGHAGLSFDDRTNRLLRNSVTGVHSTHAIPRFGEQAALEWTGCKRV